MNLARHLSRHLPIQLNIQGMIPSVSAARGLGGGKTGLNVFARAYVPLGSCFGWIMEIVDPQGNADESVHQSRRWRKRN